jgi:ATP-binding cassette subfamily F protein 3
LFARIAEDEEIYEKTRQSREKEIKRMESFINRFRAKASKASVVQSRVKALEKVERLEELSDDATLDFSFVYSDFPGRFPMEVKDLCFGFPGMERPLVDSLSFAVGKKERIAVIGKNGRGKSTLLKLLAGELSPNCGEIVVSPNTRASFFAQTNTNTLNLAHTIETEIHLTNTKLSRTAVRAICGCMMFEGDDALKKISVLSGGERSRVVLGKILATPSNMLLLDEPTNHLDVESVDALTDALERFEGAVFIVTHSEEILRRLATRLIVFQGDAPFVFEGNYEDFLERIGWEEEQQQGGGDPSQSVRKNKKGKAGAKDAKLEKAELLHQRSRLLTPLKKEIGRYEEEIAVLEKQLARSSERLAEASEKGDASAMRVITHELAECKGQLDRVMVAWETASEKAGTIEREYDEKLS